MNIENLHLFLEMMYFLSGPALVTVAIIGLKQITVARKNAEITARREAHRLATEQAQVYLRDIVPIVDKFDADLRKRKVTFLDNCDCQIDAEKIVVHFASDEEWDKHFNASKHQLPLMNSLEAFSGFFVSGVADERVAFAIVGTSFCGTVRHLLPDFVFYNSGGKYFRSVLTLFMVWHRRQQEWDLHAEREEIERKLKESKPVTITPIGLE